MKRSEMVQKIHNWYWNNYPNFRASDMLAVVESEGMVPPGVGIENEEVMSYKWEPEDKKK